MDAEPIIIPYYLNRNFMNKNPQLFFIYGAAFYTQSYEGQEGHARYCANTVSVFTKKTLCKEKDTAFWWDHELDVFKEVNTKRIDIAIEKANGRAIILFPKIGEGCAKLGEKAPLCLAWLKAELSKIVYPNVTINYNWVYQ